MPNSGIYHPGGPQTENQRKKKRDKYLDLAGELKAMEHEGNSDTSCNSYTWNNPQKLENETGRFRNTEKSPGD